MKIQKTVAIGLLGTTLDQSTSKSRWERWRPTVSLFQHEDLLIHRLELLYPKEFKQLSETITQDIKSVSPETEVTLRQIEFKDAWNFEKVYSVLLDFAKSYNFNPDKEEYLIHITTGSHVAQICEFLLTESRHFPAKLIQTSPPRRSSKDTKGSYTIIDLDLSRYDQIAQRFRKEQADSLSFLKSGIDTKNKNFNNLIEQIERVAINSKAPFLLMGPTGAGKSLLARRIYDLKKMRRQVNGPFIEINCATLRGELAMSTLFGHTKGSFTGATQDRAGLLRQADQGILFLDEIAELGLDEQAMLLKALEEKTFLPLGSDKEANSDFQLIAGTNRNLQEEVQKGTFREDLLVRINLWTFYLPPLKDRLEDIDANLQYELDKFAREHGTNTTFNKEGKQKFLKFAKSPTALWKANFRDLNAAVTRMATLSPGGRINTQIVEEEITRLLTSWQDIKNNRVDSLKNILTPEQINDIDLIEKIQLTEVIQICKKSKTLSEAGRTLFAASRQRKKNTNDADRLKKFLTRYNLTWAGIQ